MIIEINVVQERSTTDVGFMKIDTNDYPDLRNKTLQDIRSLTWDELNSFEDNEGVVFSENEDLEFGYAEESLPTVLSEEIEYIDVV